MLTSQQIEDIAQAIPEKFKTQAANMKDEDDLLQLLVDVANDPQLELGDDEELSQKAEKFNNNDWINYFIFLFSLACDSLDTRHSFIKRNESNEIHSNEGPAINIRINFNDSYLYVRNGKLHRNEGPAVFVAESDFCAEQYWIDGHRV